MNRIHKAIRNLNCTSLIKHLPKPVDEDEAEELLALTDEVAADAIMNAAIQLATATPGHKPALVLKHSERMLAYQSIRSVLRGESFDDDLGDICIF